MDKVRRQASLFQLIDRKKFDSLAEKWGIDKGVRSFSTWEMTCALVTCMLARLESLREAEAVLHVSRSTLSDALRERSYGFFQELCDQILQEIKAKTEDRRVRKAVKQLLALDSTECRVHGSLFSSPGWHTCNAFDKKASVKMHLIWNVDKEWIEDFLFVPARRHDSPASRSLKIEPNKIYVFDRGYCAVEFWLKILSARSHFVTRIKIRSLPQSERKRVLPDKDGVLHDGEYRPSSPAVIYRLAKEDRSKARFRLIIYRDAETKKVFYFLTSDFSAPAETIAAIYKKRWSVELLFRWLKSHLNIRYLPVKNKNAVKTQLAIAVLVQLLLKLQQLTHRLKGTLWEVLRRLRTSISLEGLSSSGPPQDCRWKIANQGLRRGAVL